LRRNGLTVARCVGSSVVRGTVHVCGGRTTGRAA